MSILFKTELESILLRISGAMNRIDKANVYDKWLNCQSPNKLCLGGWIKLPNLVNNFCWKKNTKRRKWTWIIITIPIRRALMSGSNRPLGITGQKYVRMGWKHWPANLKTIASNVRDCTRSRMYEETGAPTSQKLTKVLTWTWKNSDNPEVAP